MTQRPIEMRKAGVSDSGACAGRLSPDAKLSILISWKRSGGLRTKELDEQQVGARYDRIESGRLQPLLRDRPAFGRGRLASALPYEPENTPGRGCDQSGEDCQQQRDLDSGAVVPRRQN